MFSDLSIGECSGFTLPRHPKLQGIQDKSAFAGVGEEIDLDQRNRVSMAWRRCSPSRLLADQYSRRSS